MQFTEEISIVEKKYNNVDVKKKKYNPVQSDGNHSSILSAPISASQKCVVRASRRYYIDRLPPGIITEFNKQNKKA